MNPISILFLGPCNGTSLDRANALRRLGHAVEHVDLRALLPKGNWVDLVTWKLGGNYLSPWLVRRLGKSFPQRRYDICYVEGGEWVTPRIIDFLRNYCSAVVNYNIDDPLGNRDGRRFHAYRQSVASYDLCVVVRSENVSEAKSLGARTVLRVYRSADEVSHAPRALSREDHNLWDTEVLFLGTWFPERGPLLLDLVRRGVPLTIRGNRWNKAPEWPQLEPHWRGGNLHGDEYAKAIQCAKVNLGLVSRGNRDQHTTRSMEIPALGGLLCAERTSEHVALYEEGQEALFWDNADECAEVCRKALNDESVRSGIASAGRARLSKNGHYNEIVMQTVLDNAFNCRI